MKYAIWYMKPDWFREGVCYAKPDKANLEATHVHLMDVERADEVTEASLDGIWIDMQGERWSPNGEARGLIKAKGLRHTSMSVGDVIVADGETYLCASVGFEKL